MIKNLDILSKAFYCWKQKYCNGDQTIEPIDTEIRVHQENIKSINIIKLTRILGVYLTLSLSWKTQFEVMRRKISTSVAKIMNMNINPF